jgi:phosphatidylglycerophosphate synthase
MAFTYTETIQTKIRRIWWAAHGGPTGAFLRAGVLGAVGVAVVANLLPGSEPGPVAVAVLLSLLATGLAGWWLHRDFPHGTLGACNYLTLVRLLLACALTAPLVAGATLSWAFFALAALALTLDGLDGWTARREGRVSDFGARFDVEVDSLLALVLALNAALQPEISLAILLLGLPRYGFLVAGLCLPWLRAPIPGRFSRKLVCVLQLGVLIALQAPILPPLVAAVLVPSVAVLLIWSFSVDILWLWRRRG